MLVLVSCRPFVFCLFFFWFFGRAFGAFSFSFLSGLYCLVAGLFPFTFSPVPRFPLARLAFWGLGFGVGFCGRAFGAFSFSFLSGLYCLVAGLFASVL